jgi:hypothetical protein
MALTYPCVQIILVVRGRHHIGRIPSQWRQNLIQRDLVIGIKSSNQDGEAVHYNHDSRIVSMVVCFYPSSYYNRQVPKSC